MKWGEETAIGIDDPAPPEEDTIIEGKIYTVALHHDTVIEESPTQAQGNTITI